MTTTPCPALSLHLASFDPPKRQLRPFGIAVSPPNSLGVWLLPPALLSLLYPGQKNSLFQSRGTAPMWHCPLLSVAAGTLPKATALSTNTPICVTPGTPESHKAAPGRCCIPGPRAPQTAKPWRSQCCLGFPFSLAGSRSGNYFWCCLTLERVTHTQGITPDRAPRLGQRK